MKLSFSAADEQFREEIAGWLADNLCGEFEQIRGRGGPGDEHMFVEERKAWERKLHEGDVGPLHVRSPAGAPDAPSISDARCTRSSSRLRAGTPSP